MQNGRNRFGQKLRNQILEKNWVLSKKLTKSCSKIENIYKFSKTNAGTGASGNKGLAIAGGKSPIHVLRFD